MGANDDGTGDRAFEQHVPARAAIPAPAAAVSVPSPTLCRAVAAASATASCCLSSTPRRN